MHTSSNADPCFHESHQWQYRELVYEIHRQHQETGGTSALDSVSRILITLQ